MVSSELKAFLCKHGIAPKGDRIKLTIDLSDEASVAMALTKVVRHKNISIIELVNLSDETVKNLQPFTIMKTCSLSALILDGAVSNDGPLCRFINVLKPCSIQLRGCDTDFFRHVKLRMFSTLSVPFTEMNYVSFSGLITNTLILQCGSSVASLLAHSNMDFVNNIKYLTLYMSDIVNPERDCGYLASLLRRIPLYGLKVIDNLSDANPLEREQMLNSMLSVIQTAMGCNRKRCFWGQEDAVCELETLELSTSARSEIWLNYVLNIPVRVLILSSMLVIPEAISVAKETRLDELTITLRQPATDSEMLNFATHLFESSIHTVTINLWCLKLTKLLPLFTHFFMSSTTRSKLTTINIGWVFNGSSFSYEKKDLESFMSTLLVIGGYKKNRQPLKISLCSYEGYNHLESCFDAPTLSSQDQTIKLYNDVLSHYL